MFDVPYIFPTFPLTFLGLNSPTFPDFPERGNSAIVLNIILNIKKSSRQKGTRKQDKRKCIQEDKGKV